MMIDVFRTLHCYYLVIENVWLHMQTTSISIANMLVIFDSELILIKINRKLM